MRVTPDADRDAIAIIRAVLCGDELAMHAILRHCDIEAVLCCMAQMYSHGTRREANDPLEQLDRYLVNVDSWVGGQHEGERMRRVFGLFINGGPERQQEIDEYLENGGQFRQANLFLEYLDAGGELCSLREWLYGKDS